MTKTRKLFGMGGLLLLVVAVVVVSQSMFIVNEFEQAIITQFGEWKRSVEKPGLHFKKPFLQQVNLFDNRILATDAPQAEYLTQDKKRLVADPITRWRITDPLQFFKTVRDYAGARARVDDIVFAELRREVASYEFAAVIAHRREEIMASVALKAREQAKTFGIEIVDVRIKRADLPKEVQASVFARMQAERERIAKQYRAEGEEEAFKLRAETDKQKTILLAEVDKRSNILRGEGDAAATAIYASAYSKDPEFYAFLRSLQAYETFVGQKSTLLLSTNSELFRYLAGPNAAQPAGPK